MAATRHIMAEKTFTLFLTEAEKALVRCRHVARVTDKIVEAFQESIPNGPVFLTLDELDDLAFCVAHEAKYTTKKVRKKQLDHILGQIEKLLGVTQLESRGIGRPAPDNEGIALLLGMAEYTAKLKKLDFTKVKATRQVPLTLSAVERELVAGLTSVPRQLKARLREKDEFSIDDLSIMSFALTDKLSSGDGQQEHIEIAAKVLACFREGLTSMVVESPKAGKKGVKKSRRT